MKIVNFRLFGSLRNYLPLSMKFFIRNIKTFFSLPHLYSLLSFDNSDKIQKFFGMLKPYECGYPLLRHGFNGDGGYLIPESPINWDGIVSPGVGGSIDFEKNLASAKSTVVLIDGSVERPKNLPLNFHFYPKMLTNFSRNESEITIEQVLENHSLKGKSNLLQMDIEGFEWEVLPYIVNTDLLEFKVFIVEFHSLDSLSDFHAALGKEKIIKQLLNNFFVCHFHINNAGGFFFFKGKRYPKVVEITWLRRDIFLQGKPTNIPHALDFPNDSEIYDWSKFGFVI